MDIRCTDRFLQLENFVRRHEQRFELTEQFRRQPYIIPAEDRIEATTVAVFLGDKYKTNVVFYDYARSKKQLTWILSKTVGPVLIAMTDLRKRSNETI